MRIYRGDRTRATLTEGSCWTEDEEAAEVYAGRDGTVTSVEIDLDEHEVMDVEGYDHDENVTPADDPELRAQWAQSGADIVRYEDETEHGRQIVCLRVVRPAGIDL